MAATLTGLYLTILLFISASISLYLYLKQKFSFWKKKGVEYLKARTPLAHLKPIILGEECLATNIANRYKELQARNVKYGGYFLATEPIFIVLDPDLLKQMFVTDFGHFNERGMFFDERREPLSLHMFAIDYDKWHFLRSKFSPTFTPAKMKTMFPLNIACCDSLIDVLKTPAETGEPIDMYEIIARFTTDNIVSCAFGLESNSFTNPNPEFRKCGMTFAQKTVKQSLSMALALCCPQILSFFRQSYIDPSITKFFMRVLKETVDFRERTKFQRNDMLDLLIKLKNNESIDDDSDDATRATKTEDVAISFNDLASQAFIFFLGGFETSATTITFALYELALNQQIQQKLRTQVIDVTNKYNGQLTYEALNEMEYLDRVVNGKNILVLINPLVNYYS